MFRAEQTRPVRRQVALKVVKAGMDTRQVIARFEAERQALAVMDHPSIAKVHDAGTTDTGRPYFVMELVRGLSITRYCDEHHLTPRDRLGLFVHVCQAVQHAHQKGIIHRDLKPSNVLVAELDGRPLPKVIDFGVAKATGPKLTDLTLLTEMGTIVGTMEYMSPEQAELNNLDVDTRADVYSLGVILYELLTGSPPLSAAQLRGAAFDQILRMIREVEPPKPSTRLSSAAELPSIAANRQLEPRRLTRLIHGELDWVVMKCLEKDRARRYATANGLAADLLRYLADEPVMAAAPSAAYRLRKFVRRHRASVSAAAAIAVVLVAAVVGTTSALLRERHAKQLALIAADAERHAKETATAREAETRGVLEFVQGKVLAAARPAGQAGGLGRDVTLRKAFEAVLPAVATSFPGQPLVEARVRITLGTSFSYLGDWRIAAEQLETAHVLYSRHAGIDHTDTLASANNLANAYDALGRHADAMQLREETLARSKAKLGPDHFSTIACMSGLANSYEAVDRHADALQLREEALRRMRAKFGPDHQSTLMSMQNLANSYYILGRHAEALALREQTLSVRREKLGADHPDTLLSMHNLARSYIAFGRHAQAVDLYERALSLMRSKLGDDHPHTLRTMQSLMTGYGSLGRHADALKVGQEALLLRKAKLGLDHVDTLASMMLLANVHEQLGQRAEALALREETLKLHKTRLGPDHPDTLRCMHNLAYSYLTFNRYDEALALIDDALGRVRGTSEHPKLTAMLLEKRLRVFQARGDARGCLETAGAREALQPSDPRGLYVSGYIRAICATVLRATDQSAESAARSNDQADQAVAWLRRAVAAGYAELDTIRDDFEDLPTVRERADFKELVVQLQSRRSPASTTSTAR